MIVALTFAAFIVLALASIGLLDGATSRIALAFRKAFRGIK